jgi:hypothetical protein
VKLRRIRQDIGPVRGSAQREDVRVLEKKQLFR